MSFIALVERVGKVLIRSRLKLKRPQTAKMYRKELDELYAEILAEEDGARKVKARL